MGKTTLAGCIANETGKNIQYANGAALRTIKNIVPYIMRINYGDILFCDEIHRSSKVLQEFMYSVMEDFFCVVGSGDDIIKLKVPKFTLILATTEYGSLLKPLRERIKIPLIFSLYHPSDLSRLALLNADRLKIGIDPTAADDIAKRSRGVPRVLNRLLEWCRDYCLARGDGQKITTKIVDESMKMYGIDENGFTKDDQKVILILEGSKRPVPLKTLSAMSGISEVTLLEEVEPFLIAKGIMTKTTKGRILC